MNKGCPEFHLRVTDDHMAVLLDCTVPGEGLDVLLTDIESELLEIGIANAPNREQLEERLRRAAKKGNILVDEVLVKGNRPVPPKDGEIKWAQDFFRTGFVVDEKTGAIDYWRPAAQLSVEEGQLLVRVTHPKEGKDGLDVFGKPIRANKPKRARIRMGSNVRVEKKEDAFYYYAVVQGRIRWDSETLAVDDVYTIPGDVGLETGYINHPGALMIEGDVLAGSQIKAGGDIEVKGVIEPADIQAGGDLTVQGGITGAEDRSIKVAGSVRARYISEADIEAGEDIVVKNEILHSTLRARGTVDVSGGRLAGGEVMALGGIVVGQAGSDGLVPTLMIVAEDYRLAEKLHAKEKQTLPHKENLRKIHERIDPLLVREDRLSHKQREIVAKMLDRASEEIKAIEDLHTEMNEIKAESGTRARGRILIKTEVYPEATLRISGKALLVTETCLGPLAAVLEEGEVALKATQAA